VVVRPSATLEKRLANHVASCPRGVPLLKRVIAVGGEQICRSAGVVYVNGTVAAEALDHDPEGRRCLSGKGAGGSSKVNFSSCNPISVPSTAGISDRSATAKSSASCGRCGRGIHRTDTPVLSPARIIEHTWAD